jgi:hypothetical protein
MWKPLIHLADFLMGVAAARDAASPGDARMPRFLETH